MGWVYNLQINKKKMQKRQHIDILGDDLTGSVQERIF
jgi:hypothetical protein